jgi:hypothetical protein
MNAINKPLPFWAKLLIIFMVASSVSIVSLIVVFYSWVYPKLLESNRPENINKVAAHIATFSQYPPPGFKFSLGLELFNVYTLIAEHTADRQNIFLISYPFVQGDASTIVDAISANSVQTPSVGAHFNSVTSKGEIQVAHEKMPYVIGTVSEHDRISEAMFGCSVVKSSKRTICALTVSPAGGGLSFKDVVSLLGSIEKWN